MRKKPFITALAVVLSIMLIAPVAFFAAPQKASASILGCVGGLVGGLIPGLVETGLSVPVSNLSISTATGGTQVATMDSCITDTILIPLARAAIRSILQQMTASVIGWITGRNGTGRPSFVTNLSVNLQGVGDAAALSLIGRITTGFNSPFGPAIASSLQLRYNQQTSLAGFFATNQSTLARYSPNPNAFLAGNWSQGGIPEWFALTTQTQNNPYLLYGAAESQVGSSVTQATTNRRQDLIQSQGFLSWCGGDTTASQTSTTIDQSTADAARQQCLANGGTADQCQTVYETYLSQVGTSVGVSPQAPCTNPNGTPAQAQTPGSVIHDYTQKAVVNSGFDQLISANDLDSALNAIVSTLLNQVLGNAGGLLGSSAPAPGGNSRSSVTSQLNNYQAANTNSSQSSISLAESTLLNITNYTTAWNTITAAADTASTSLDSLASFCTAAVHTAESDQIQNLAAFTAAATAQATAARAVIPAQITPIIAQAQTAIAAVASTTAFAHQVEEESIAASSVTSATTGAVSTLSSDIATLTTMPPSASDVAAVQQNSQVFGGAQANPAGSFTVSGGSLVDRMNLISANATALKDSVCNPQSSLYATSGGG